MLPAEVMGQAGTARVSNFVPITVEAEAAPPPERHDAADGIIDIQIGDDIVIRVPGAVAVDRAVALVRVVGRHDHRGPAPADRDRDTPR